MKMLAQKTDGYIAVRDKSSYELSQYSNRCEREHLPIVYIVTHGKYATVEMDLIFAKGRDNCQHNSLFEERIVDACEKATGDYNSPSVPGCLSYMKHVPAENAETLALSFLAIYYQMQGNDIPLPTFKHAVPFRNTRARLETAKQQGYAVVSGMKDQLSHRYTLWCKATKHTCIVVYEKRKGYAEVNFSMHLDAKIPDNISKNIRRIAEELCILHHSQVKNMQKPFYIETDDGIHMGKTVPTDIAVLFAKSIVHLFRGSQES